ncbi:MAG TPA: alanine racemase [Minicystis sp.]|nr:alanine racemase [Minicystis sp.]
MSSPKMLLDARASEPPVEHLPASRDRRDGGGASVRVLKPRRAAPADAVRPTRAEVNLGHLRHNLRVLERTLGPASASRPAIWAVLKADAYGHGAPAVARTLERAGVAGLCVALLEEALELREAGITAPILVMSGYYGPRREGLDEMVANELVPVVYETGQVERIASIARLRGAAASVHLKVDTGMGRLGAPERELDTLLDAVAAHPEVRIDGFMTHFACADADDPSATREQLRRFDVALGKARARGHAPRFVHAANSAAMLRLPETRLSLVRPGIALYGVSPFEGGEDAFASQLKPVMRVRTEVVALREVKAGERIGYGHTWEAPRASVIATVPMGYADGLSRALSNRGHALVRGRRAPVVGAVSMDLTMIDVTDAAGARLGDEVVFLGPQEGSLGKDCITAAEIAKLTATIPWEVLTSISRRVPRFYREP